MKYSLLLLSTQGIAGIITICGALLVLGVVVFLITTSKVEEDGKVVALIYPDEDAMKTKMGLSKF